MGWQRNLISLQWAVAPAGISAPLAFWNSMRIPLAVASTILQLNPLAAIAVPTYSGAANNSAAAAAWTSVFIADLPVAPSGLAAASAGPLINESFKAPQLRQ